MLPVEYQLAPYLFLAALFSAFAPLPTHRRLRHLLRHQYYHEAYKWKQVLSDKKYKIVWTIHVIIYDVYIKYVERPLTRKKIDYFSTEAILKTCNRLISSHYVDGANSVMATMEPTYRTALCVNPQCRKQIHCDSFWNVKMLC